MSEYNGSEHHLSNVSLARARSIEVCGIQTIKRISEYEENPKLCKTCNQALPYKNYKRKTFCGSSCAAKHTNLGKLKSEKCRDAIRQKVLIRTVNKQKLKGIYPRICLVCTNTLLSKQARFCSKACMKVWNKTPAEIERRRLIIKKVIDEGRHQGWSSRNGKPPSYPEQYFMGLFENENIEYEREVKCEKFFIDFLIGNLAVEIDGSQHLRPDYILSDKRKDIRLKANGYEVIRIAWTNPSTLAGKAALYPQIERLKIQISNHFNV